MNNLEQQLDAALLKLATGETRAIRREAFEEMRRLKQELAKDTERVAAHEKRLGLIP